MKICLVSNEILGAVKNGGIGTATSQLSILLGKRGHSVTLFYVGMPPLDPSDLWAVFYRAAKVRVTHFPGTQAPIYPGFMKQPCEIYEQLRDQDFDLVLFQEWMALGHSCVIAKKCGLAFQQTVLATIAHSSTPWIMEANRCFPRTPSMLALSYLEQRAVEESDALVSPSNYLVDWMRRAGWNLPERTEVIPYYMHAHDLLGVSGNFANRVTVRRGRQIVFFGRLEERKGINLFLQSLATEKLAPYRFRLTFLGKPATKSINELREDLSKIRPDLVEELEFKPDCSSDEALTYLTVHDSVAVVPSLVDNSPCVIYELLRLGVPFIASAAGGIPELIDKTGQQRILFQPTVSALAAKLSEVLEANEWPLALPRFEPSRIADLWLSWFERIVGRRSIRTSAPSVVRPAHTVTVAVTHYERPKLLDQNLSALALQTDADFKLVVVDDGSKTASALEYLETIQDRYRDLHPLLIKQQPNQYLGAARNTAVRHTDTPYVIFLDDDNIPFPNMIEIFKRAIASSQADVVSCQMVFFHDPLNEPDLSELFVSTRWAFPAGPAALGLIQNCFGDATAIYKRELFGTAGYFHEIHGTTYEDWELHLRWALAGCKILSLPLPLFWYRVTPGSMSRSTNGYSNMQVIASAFRQSIPPLLAPIVDLLVGSAMAEAQTSHHP
jgi:glycosyltransferase involved in cell wall biosynthesis/GT2 family glycosyltransferase